jgi:hypothetical protein
VLVVEDFCQHIEERLPEAGTYGVQPTVEAALGDCLGYVAVLVEERAARLELAGEERRANVSNVVGYVCLLLRERPRRGSALAPTSRYAAT